MISGFKSHLADVNVSSTKKVTYTCMQFTMADLRKIVADNKEVPDDAKVNIRYYGGSGYGYGETSSSTIEIVES